MKRIFCFSVVLGATAFACVDDPRADAAEYAKDPISCVQDSDCCVVNDGCHSTAYIVASKDSSTVASLIASADNSRCDRCVTPMAQVSCVSGVCATERINLACQLPTPYPGNHCGKLDLPTSCLSSSSSVEEGARSGEGTLKTLAILRCGG